MARFHGAQFLPFLRLVFAVLRGEQAQQWCGDVQHEQQGGAVNALSLTRCKRGNPLAARVFDGTAAPGTQTASLERVSGSQRRRF